MLSQTAVSQIELLKPVRKKRVMEALSSLEENPFRNRPGADLELTSRSLDIPPILLSFV
jgi:hypothetical protein